MPSATTSFEEFIALLPGRRVVPVTRELFADGETPVGIYRKLAEGRPGTFLLESAEQGGIWSRYSFVGASSYGVLTERDGRVEWQDYGLSAERALGSPLIDAEIVHARGILLSIAGGDDLSLYEVNEAAEVVRQTATDETNIIFGATVDPRLTGQVWVTVVATGLGGVRRRARPTFEDSGPAADRSSGPRPSEPELPSFLNTG